MSNQKWILFLIVLAAFDLLQFFMTPLVFISSAIDIVIGFLLPIALHLAGERMNFKRLLSIATVFGIELVPALNAIPLWSLYLIALYILSKVTAKFEEKLPAVAKIVSRLPNIRKPLNSGGVRAPSGRDTI